MPPLRIAGGNGPRIPSMLWYPPGDRNSVSIPRRRGKRGGARRPNGGPSDVDERRLHWRWPVGATRRVVHVGDGKLGESGGSGRGPPEPQPRRPRAAGTTRSALAAAPSSAPLGAPPLARSDRGRGAETRPQPSLDLVCDRRSTSRVGCARWHPVRTLRTGVGMRNGCSRDRRGVRRQPGTGPHVGCGVWGVDHPRSTLGSCLCVRPRTSGRVCCDGK